MEDIIPFFVVALVVLVIVVSVSWTFRRSRRLLENWASSQRMEIVSAEFRWFFRGPFFWTTSKNQTVYRITVMDEHGEMLSGWARCGSFWWGIFSDRVDVRWDEV